jgi:hypothetical protein
MALLRIWTDRRSRRSSPGVLTIEVMRRDTLCSRSVTEATNHPLGSQFLAGLPWGKGSRVFNRSGGVAVARADPRSPWPKGLLRKRQYQELSLML